MFASRHSHIAASARLAALALAAAGVLAACGGHSAAHEASSGPAVAAVEQAEAAPAADKAQGGLAAVPTAPATTAPTSASLSAAATTSKPAAKPDAPSTSSPPITGGAKPSPSDPPSSTRPGPVQLPPRVLGPADLDSRAWLNADETPLNYLYHWTWATMLPPANPGHFSFTTGMPCITTSLDSLGATAVIPHDTDADPSTATQDKPSVSIQERLFTFPDAAKAAAAFTAVRTGMGACVTAAGDAKSPGTHTTVSTGDGAAWATYPQPLPPGVYSAVFENHDYLVVKGQLLAVVTVGIAGRGQPDADYHTDGDQSVLTSVSKHLSIYS